MDNLNNIIEGIVFACGAPISYSDILGKIDITKKELEIALNEIRTKYSKDSGIQLLIFGTKIQFATNPKYADEIANVLNPIRERALSNAAMETLAIIAYRQPITRLEIEEIRGVGADYAINLLLEHKLIEVVGRKEVVGRPALFGTTDEFLKRFDLSSTNDLPDYSELTERISKINEAQDSRLYNYNMNEDGSNVDVRKSEQLGKENEVVKEESSSLEEIEEDEDLSTNRDDDLL